MTVNDDISDQLIDIWNLKTKLVDIPHMIIVVKNLNNRLANCKDGMEKQQAFIEAAELFDRNVLICRSWFSLCGTPWA